MKNIIKMGGIKKMVSREYENNISEDIVYSDDTLDSTMIKVSNKLSKKKPFFLVVLNREEKIIGVIKLKQLKSMIDQAKSTNSFDIPFGPNVSSHTIIEEEEIQGKAEKELKNLKNEGFILIKNKNGNYLGKKFLSS